MVDLNKFNWRLYGDIVREARYSRGFTSAASFCREIYRSTRVVISYMNMYTIENGQTTVSATKFFAINVTLWGSPIPSKVFYECSGRCLVNG